MNIILYVVCALSVVSAIRGYDILCVFPIPSHSHNQLGKAVVDILLNAGHSVTWVTPYGDKVPKDVSKNLKVIDVSPVQRFAQGAPDLTNPANVNIVKGFRFVKDYARDVNVEVLKTPAVIDAVTTTKYDAVITEKFLADFDAGYAAVLQVPWLLVNGVQMYPMLEQQVDEVRSVPTVPLMFNDSPIPMTFYSRAVNAFVYIFMTVASWFDKAETVELYTSLFSPLAAARGVTLPPLDEALYNVSILFVNSHESVSPAFSTPPNVINVAGYHIDQNPPALPKDLQELMDESKQGVVYFSMGSIIKSAALGPELRAGLLKIFSKLSHTVLWKFEEDIPEKLPPNVHIRKWFPQVSVLAHPNLRLFITHGGGLSTLEAVHAGVPLLAVPVFGDQPANAERATRNGFALRVKFSPDMAPEFEEKLNEILKNDSYYKKAKHLSKLFNNRPVHPTELIKHYVELAIETKGAVHLRSVSLQYSWVARWMLDVVLAVLAVLTALLVALLAAGRRCLSYITGNNTKHVGKSGNSTNSGRRDKKKVKKN